ncbi:MAG TPA: amidohydrolase family protein [Terriglobales bacterium]|nr:amidohydrolase family protein [Terriglobales bacterium]
MINCRQSTIMPSGNLHAGYAHICCADGLITSVTTVSSSQPDESWLCPGFIDLQVNGFAGIDFSDPNLRVEQAIRVLPAVWATGVTSFYPTLITNSYERLRRNFAVLEEARRACTAFQLCVPGYHLEGPYFPDGPARGVHNPEFLRSPDWDEFTRLQEAAGHRIKIVTLAPELPGALEFIARCVRAGVVCAIGHTDATATVIHAAVDAGARLSTHLGNGCATMIDRHQNPLWPQLANERLHVSLICDGFHLPEDLLRVIVKVKGVNGCILVTDAIHVANMPPGRYTLVDMPVELLPSGKVVKRDRASMAGSALAMNRAVSIFQQHASVSFEDACIAATKNPASLLNDRGVCQEIAAGQPANLIRVVPQSGELRVLEVWIGGDPVWAREEFLR